MSSRDEAESDRIAADDGHAGPGHLVDCGIDVAGDQAHAAAAVLDQERLEAEPDGVQRRVLHAVIGGQPQQVDAVDALFLQVVAQAGGLPVIVVEPAAASRFVDGPLLRPVGNQRSQGG